MDNKLRQLQLTQLEILKLIDRICRENNLKYFLYAGTLLGAVRHKGFIPWDDDLDVCMLRPDYERFIEIWDDVSHEGYLLQNKENAPKFSQSFTKIRKEHTTFIQFEGEGELYHTGIFVDIFPVDRLPEGKLKKYMFYWNCMRYQLFTREFVPPKENKIVRLVSEIMLKSVSEEKRPALRKRLLQKITSYKNDTSLKTVTIEVISALFHHYDKDMFENPVLLPFEDGEFMCVSDWDGQLKQIYGDYMQLPPENKRTWAHHPVILDFEHDYEELKNLNK